MIFDVGNVLVRWDARLLFRQLLPDEAAIEAFLAETGFDAWNLELDAGLPWDVGVAALSARHPHHAGTILAFHARWHETLPGAIDGCVGDPRRPRRRRRAALRDHQLFAARSGPRPCRAFPSSPPPSATPWSRARGVVKPDARDLPPAASTATASIPPPASSSTTARGTSPAPRRSASTRSASPTPEASATALAARGLLAAERKPPDQPEAPVRRLREAADRVDRDRGREKRREDVGERRRNRVAIVAERPGQRHVEAEAIEDPRVAPERRDRPRPRRRAPPAAAVPAPPPSALHGSGRGGPRKPPPRSSTASASPSGTSATKRPTAATRRGRTKRAVLLRGPRRRRPAPRRVAAFVSRNGAFSVAWKPYGRGSAVIAAAARPAGGSAGGRPATPASASQPSHSAPKRASGRRSGRKIDCMSPPLGAHLWSPCHTTSAPCNRARPSSPTPASSSRARLSAAASSSARAASPRSTPARASAAAPRTCEGDLLAPGLVELHTDNLERHLEPRPGVVWPDGAGDPRPRRRARRLRRHHGLRRPPRRLARRRRQGRLRQVRPPDRHRDQPAARRRAAPRPPRLHLRAEVCSETLIEELAEFHAGRRRRHRQPDGPHPGQRQFTDVGQQRKYATGRARPDRGRIRAHIAGASRSRARVGAGHETGSSPPPAASARRSPATTTRPTRRSPPPPPTARASPSSRPRSMPPAPAGRAASP